MSRTPHKDVQMLRAATRLGDPAAGLMAVAELRRVLETWEAAHVDEAVATGWSWQRIADSLGVTKQAAHARHARRNQRPPQSGLVVTGHARRAVQRARDEAIRLGADRLETDHLLLGLLLDAAEGPVKIALDDCGITREGVLAGSGPRGPGGTARPTVSPQVREALEHSMREALARGDARLDLEHLLLAVLHEPGGRGQRAVIAAGRSPLAVERRLNRALKAQSGTGLSGSSRP